MERGPTANGYWSEPIPARSAVSADDPRMSEDERRIRQWYREHQDEPTVDQARRIDRALNSTTDPAEMTRLITLRRGVRAAMDFEEAMRQFERENPVRPMPETFREV